MPRAHEHTHARTHARSLTHAPHTRTTQKNAACVARVPTFFKRSPPPTVPVVCLVRFAPLLAAPTRVGATDRTSSRPSTLGDANRRTTRIGAWLTRNQAAAWPGQCVHAHGLHPSAHHAVWQLCSLGPTLGPQRVVGRPAAARHSGTGPPLSPHRSKPTTRRQSHQRQETHHHHLRDSRGPARDGGARR